MFENNKPGCACLKSFLDRHPNLSLRLRVNLKSARADNMNLENVATDPDRISSIISKFHIHDPTKKINVHESGFSIYRMTFGRSMCSEEEWTRGNRREIKFRGTFDYISLVSVV